MTAEKLYAVTRPIKAHQVKLNKKQSTIFLILALVLCTLVNSHFLFTYSLIDINLKLSDTTDKKDFDKILKLIEKTNNYSKKLETTICSFTRWDSFYNEYWAYIDASIYSFIPFIFLCAFNVLIVQKMKKANKLRANLLASYQKSHTFGSLMCSLNSLKMTNKNRTFDGTHYDTNKDEVCNLENTPKRLNSQSQCSTNSINLKRKLRKSNESNDIKSLKHDIIVKYAQKNSNPYSSHFDYTLSHNDTKIRHNSDGRTIGKVEYFENNNRSNRNIETNEKCHSNRYSLPSSSPSSIILIKKLRNSFGNSILARNSGSEGASVNKLLISNSTLNSQQNKIKISNKKLTVMMFFINISFCIMSMPIVILQIYYDTKRNEIFEQISTNRTDSKYIQNFYNNIDLLKAIAEILQYLNHSINFFLYIFSGKTFREETIDYLKTKYSSLKKFKNSILKKS